MALETYRKKRNFKNTPEPAGRVGPRRARHLSFVIQKHAASHLHYDFRLELDGVLLSWAVPKGPSLDPADKRLAMHVEDHPLEYGDFEGVIPPKQYGSGTVLLWDRGTWEPREDPRAGYAKGKLKFDLHGEKLQGGWTLVRSHGGKYDREKSWLLIKEDDAYARRGIDARIVDERPESVATGRSLDAIAQDPDRVWDSNKSVAENARSGAVKKRKPKLDAASLPGARKAALPDFVQPQLATLVENAPEGGEWVHEIKYDGYRMLCRVEKGACTMYSRNGKDWTADFPAIAAAAARLPVQTAWIDGEVIASDAQGRSSFQALQNAMSEGAASLVYYAFDLMYVDGYDLRGVPLVQRKAFLGKLLGAHAPLRFSDHISGNGAAFLAEACKLGLEGIVSKRASSTYQGKRSGAWIKVKCAQRQELVIGGYTDPQGSRSGFGALLLGVYDATGELRYAGKVGTGFNAATLATLHKRMRKLATDRSPFVDPPAGAEGRRAHWIRPELVAEVAFTEWTRDNTLRHPSFQGLREDKKAREVVRETAVEPSASADEPSAERGRVDANDAGAVAGIRISNPDKLLYREAGITKREVAEYYAAVGDLIVPHLSHRPLTLKRCPEGWDRECFYQKHAAPGVPAVIDRVQVREGSGRATYLMANSTAAVVALLQLGVLELHPWGSREENLDSPDRIVFDLDPDEDLEWERVKEAATVTRRMLETLGLQVFVKTTGGKGLHLVVPIAPKWPWDDITGFTKAAAELLVRTFPDRFTSKMTKATRTGRVFVDYLRNAQGATAIATYSVRAKANAPVSMPIAWSELKRDLRFAHFNVRNVPALLKRRKDPWSGFFAVRQEITPEMMQRVGYAPNARVARSR